MTVREGKIGIAKVEEDTYEIRLGQPELQPGDNCSFWCRVEFDADEMMNVDMTTGAGELWGWPPKEFEGGYYTRRGYLGYAPRFQLVRPSYVRCMIASPPPDVEYNTSPYFDATYIDETVEEPQEEVLADGARRETWRASDEDATTLFRISQRSDFVGWL